MSMHIFLFIEEAVYSFQFVWKNDHGFSLANDRSDVLSLGFRIHIGQNYHGFSLANDRSDVSGLVFNSHCK